MRYFLLGFDPAQIRDFAALGAIEVTYRESDLLFKLVGLERRQRLSYPALVSWVVSALKNPVFNEDVTRPPKLILDSTGIGIAIKDLLVKAGVSPVSVTITPGNSVTYDSGNYHVGKALLIGKFLAAFDSQRFLINPNHPMYAQFERELLAFKAEISARGNAIFEAEEGQHDDLISACALTTWWAEKNRNHSINFEGMELAATPYQWNEYGDDEEDDQGPEQEPNWDEEFKDWDLPEV